MIGTLLSNFEITGTTPDGRAYGMHKGITVFVDKAVPGDVADVQMIKSFHKDKSIATGKIVSLKKNSSLRIPDFCKHFEYCGGCQWQNISYETQLQLKQQQVDRLFERFTEPFEKLPILPSPQQKYFRNKVTFTFSNRRWMSPEELNDPEVQKQPAGGYVLKGNNDRIMNIEECFLSDEFAMSAMKSLRTFALEKEFPFYDVRHEKGFLRNLAVRFGDDDEVMVLVGFGNDDIEKINQVMKFLAETFPRISSLYYSFQPRKETLRFKVSFEHYAGKKFLEYKMEDLVFRSGPASFYQTNTLQTFQLYKTARTFAELTGEEVVYDLYTGTGTIALFISGHAKKVVGIDNVTEAIEDAKANAARNKRDNVFFLAGDLKESLTEEVYAIYGKPEVIITDPPRSGMHREGIQRLLNSDAKKIVYISCNPVTQARDLRYLSLNYRLKKSQAVDMFPQTSHVENVVLLEKRGDSSPAVRGSE
jgi:23S rRNA (uracil1939-C5)-methyltransferase